VTTVVAVICIVVALVVGVVLGALLAGIARGRARSRGTAGSPAPAVAAGGPPPPADESPAARAGPDGDEHRAFPQDSPAAVGRPAPAGDTPAPEPVVAAAVPGDHTGPEPNTPTRARTDAPAGPETGEAAPAVTEEDTPGGGTEGEPSDAGPDRRGRILDAVWRLQCLDVELDRRRQAGLSTASADSGGPDLAGAVQQEITRIREEIGTPGSFRSYLDTEPDPAVAVLVLRSVQSTLDVVARRAQAFDLELRRRDGRLLVTVLCDDFEGLVPTTGTEPDAVTGPGDAAPTPAPPPSTPGESPPGVVGEAQEATVDDEAAAIAAAVALAGGSLVFDLDLEGRVRASLSVPVG
jgi:hypothetical protein